MSENLNEEEQITLLDIIKGTLKEEDFSEQLFSLTQKVSKGNKYINLFLKTFDKVSVHNEFYARLSLHLILGQIFKNFKLYVYGNYNDLRVHPFIMAPSGSGKSVAEAFIYTIAQKLNIPFEIITGEVNEASLIGSWVPDKRNPNIMVLEEGILKRYEKGGILLADEGAILLKSTKKNYNLLLLLYLQSAMNPIGSPSNTIVRNLKYGVIKVEPQCSFGILTYPVKELLLETLRMGLFQRALLYIRVLSPKDWLKMSEAIKQGILISQNQSSFNLLIKNYYDNIADLSNYLNGVKLWSTGLSKLIIQSDTNAKQIDKFIAEYNELCSKVKDPMKEILDSFRNRSLVEIFKLASHKALLDKRLVITDEDINYGLLIVKKSLNSIYKALESLEEVAKTVTSPEARWNKFKANLQFLKIKHNPDGTIPSNELINLIINFFGLSRSSAFRLLEEWEREGLIRWFDKSLKNSRIKI
jgi:histone H3/H4